MEKCDIYNEQGDITGRKIERGKKMNKGEYHLASIVCLKNSQGELLISKRSSKKSTGPNKWETVPGSAIAGESSIQTAVREVKEEIGIELNPKEGVFIKRLKFDTEKSWFGDVWLFEEQINILDVKCQEEEVSEVKWISKNEFTELMKNGELFNDYVFEEFIWEIFDL